MCHVSEFQKILDFNYTRIGLSIYVKFSLGKWLGTRQKIIQNHEFTKDTKSGKQLPSAWPKVLSSYRHITSVRNVSITKQYKWHTHNNSMFTYLGS